MYYLRFRRIFVFLGEVKDSGGVEDHLDDVVEDEKAERDARQTETQRNALVHDHDALVQNTTGFLLRHVQTLRTYGTTILCQINSHANISS